MGGKQNRTRNNVRPSNSGRSAAMLHSTLPQFSGFAGPKPTGLSSFAINPVDELDKSLDSNFQFVLKKVSKKDCTTKLKGLQEFAELLQEAETGTVKTLLSTWTRFYSVLVIHPDNRVREAAQNAHCIIVQKAKRDIAPFLKQLMAPWYISQYDNYPPAAAAALKAFKDTFSPVKFKEAVIFCHQEIINYIHNNLLVQTTQTVSSSQLSPQEAEARYERMVISCLQGYAMYLKEVPEEKVAECLSLHNEIWSNKKYWKLSQSKVALIRGSWFQVLSVTLQNGVYLLSGKESQVFSTILNNLEDQDVLVIPHVWDCLLLASRKPEWWNSINTEQTFMSKLFAVLKQGGYGNATIIYPNLVLLLSHLLPVVQKTIKTFYLSFFNNFLTGLKLKQVVGSVQETKAISVAFMECLQFAIRNNTNPDLYKILFSPLFNCIEWCFSKDAPSYKIIFAQIAVLISNLRKQENHAVVIKIFLDLLKEMFTRCLVNIPEVQLAQMVHKLVGLLLALKNGACDENDSFATELLRIALNLYERCAKLGESSIAKEIIASFVALIKGFGKNQFFRGLQEVCKSETVDFLMMDIYSKLFVTWLFCEETFCKSVVDLVFLLLDELNDNDKEIVLNDLLKVNQSECMSMSVLNALSPPHNTDPVVQKWLKGDAIGRHFVNIVDQCVSDQYSLEDSALLKAALTETAEGNFLLNNTIIDQIIEKISTITLSSNNPSTYRLASDICKLVYTPKSLLNHGDQLLLSLFALSCQTNHDNRANIENVRAAWTKSLSNILPNLSDCDGRSLLEKFINCVYQSLRQAIVQKTRNRLNNLKGPIGDLIATVYVSRPWLLTWMVEYPTQMTILSKENVVQFCKMAEYVKGSLASPTDKIDIKSPISNEDLLDYFTYSFLIIEMLNTSLSNDHSPEDDDEKTASTNLTLDAFDKAEKLAEIIYINTINEMFLGHFNIVKDYTELLHYQSLSESTTSEILRKAGNDNVQKTKEVLLKKASEQGWFWCKALSKIDIEPGLVSIENINTIGALHLKQTFPKPNNSEPGQYAMSLVQDIEKVRQSSLDQFSYKDCTISWQKGGEIIDAMEKCITLMESCDLTTNYWDLIVLSMDSWASSCLQHARQMINHYQYQRIVIALTTLYQATCKKVATLKEADEESNRVQEWEDVLIENVHANLTKLWLFAAEHFNSSESDPILTLPFVQRFGQIVNYFRTDLIFKESTLSPKWSVFLKASNVLLTNRITVLQLWGYKMLLVLTPGLVKIDTEAVNNSAPHKNGLIFEQFRTRLLEFQDIVNSMLGDFKIGEDSCMFETSYDSFTYTFAYLILWDVVIRFFDDAPAELRFQYSDWLKDGPLLRDFLISLFKLMPVGTLLKEDTKDSTLSSMFSNNPIDQIGYERHCGSDVIEHFACYLFKSALEQFPALIRQWWTVLDVKTSQLVEKITVFFVSPLICSSELNEVMQHQSGFKNLKVRILPSVREIHAVYAVDEAQMELTVILPPNYPLGSPDIISERQISGTSQNWLLQFKKCVLHENGKIWDGLTIWNASLDKKFEGVEECFICYAVLHSGTYQLPKVSCRTCKKKFHSVCLYKWFSTSNKSSCPICRNLF